MSLILGTLALPKTEQFLIIAITAIMLFVVISASRMRYMWESALTVVVGVMLIVMYYYLWLAALAQNLYLNLSPGNTTSS